MPKRTVTILGTQKTIFEQIEEKSLQNSFLKILQFVPIIALSLDSALKEMIGSSSKKKANMFSERINRGSHNPSNPSHYSKYLRKSRSKMNPRESRSIWDLIHSSKEETGMDWVILKWPDPWFLEWEQEPSIKTMKGEGRSAKKRSKSETNIGKPAWRVRKVIKSQSNYASKSD